MSDKEKGAGSKDVDKMNKTEKKAYYKEIRAFYLENGWRDTLSRFSLSPKQAAEIIDREDRVKRKEIEKQEKRSSKKKDKDSSDSAPKKRGRPKKDKSEDNPSKPGRKKKEKSDENVAPKKRQARMKNPEDADAVLDYLLQYRKKHGSVTLDAAIVDLTLRSRSN